MKYIDSEIIVNDVKNRMAAYFASNKVDESIFPRVIRRCVGQMGLKILPEKRGVVHLKNYKAELPEGLRQITLVMMCERGHEYVKDNLRSGTQVQVIEIGDKCNVCLDECGNTIKLVYEDVYQKMTYEHFNLLKPSKGAISHCANNCLNRRSRCSEEFDVSENRGVKTITTTIPEGPLYIEYLSDLEGEDGFMIPDNETVKDWIFEELRREAYTAMYDNGEDVLQRMQHSERELNIKQERARQIYTRREVHEYYSMANRLAHRYGEMERRLHHDTWSRVNC